MKGSDATHWKLCLTLVIALLPDCAAFPAETVEVGGGESKEPEEEVKEEEKEEALVAAIDVKVLHRRVGHLGKVERGSTMPSMLMTSCWCGGRRGA